MAPLLLQHPNTRRLLSIQCHSHHERSNSKPVRHTAGGSGPLLIAFEASFAGAAAAGCASCFMLRAAAGEELCLPGPDGVALSIGATLRWDAAAALLQVFTAGCEVPQKLELCSCIRMPGLVCHGGSIVAWSLPIPFRSGQNRGVSLNERAPGRGPLDSILASAGQRFQQSGVSTCRLCLHRGARPSSLTAREACNCRRRLGT